jgi:hypothetical protein
MHLHVHGYSTRTHAWRCVPACAPASPCMHHHLLDPAALTTPTKGRQLCSCLGGALRRGMRAVRTHC